MINHISAQQSPKILLYKPTPQTFANCIQLIRALAYLNNADSHHKAKFRYTQTTAVNAKYTVSNQPLVTRAETTGP